MMPFAALIPLIPGLVAGVRDAIKVVNDLFKNKQKSGKEKAQAVLGMVTGGLALAAPKGSPKASPEEWAAFIEGIFQVMKASGEVDGPEGSTVTAPAPLTDVPIGTQVVEMTGSVLVIMHK